MRLEIRGSGRFGDFGTRNPTLVIGRVGQFHHVIEAASLVILTDVQDGELAGVRARDGLRNIPVIKTYTDIFKILFDNSNVDLSLLLDVLAGPGPDRAAVWSCELSVTVFLPMGIL